jgi:solute carrier family 8 (sodium/calcium exchanger)
MHAGTAAFSLFVILGVCILAVPEGKVRSISQFSVFLCTSAFSLWAYLWVLVVYDFWTPNEVTLAEAFLTLLWLPILVFQAYLIDAQPWRRLRLFHEDQSDVNHIDQKCPSNTNEGLHPGYAP